MNTRMEMCVGEILDLAAWVEKLGLQRKHHVVIEQSSGGGIGFATQAQVKTSENEGVFIDITDYDMW